MFQKSGIRWLVLLILGVHVAACQDSKENATNAAAGEEKPGVEAGSSPGKPTAPISIQYDVIGHAVVGQPVSVNLQLASTQAEMPVTLDYRINDASAMVFPESQAQRIETIAAPSDRPRMHQVTVIPQREGRLFLNVSAEVETVNGTLFRSIAVPIQVGSAAGTPAVNGAIGKTAEGEDIVSMPADESGASESPPQ
jgi:hypothetical protein